MKIENVPFEFCYDTRGHSFELMLGGGGIGGMVISGTAQTKWAQLAMRALVSAGRKNDPGRHHRNPRDADRVGVNTESINILHHENWQQAIKRPNGTLARFSK